MTAPPLGPHRVGANIIKVTDHWIVAVTPMIYNDRVLLIDRGHWDLSGPEGAGWVAGYCYDRGPAAVLAALAWNPEEEQHPAGWKKIAGDAR